MAEHRQYHRNEKGQIVKVMDDILDAGRYAYMMRRYAIKQGDIKSGDGWSDEADKPARRNP